MAVPKRRWSKARSRRQHAQWKLKKPNLVEDPQTHELVMPHRVCKVTGMYKGREILTREQ